MKVRKVECETGKEFEEQLCEVVRDLEEQRRRELKNRTKCKESSSVRHDQTGKLRVQKIGKISECDCARKLVKYCSAIRFDELKMISKL